jgi:hypothetical protein
MTDRLREIEAEVKILERASARLVKSDRPRSAPGQPRHGSPEKHVTTPRHHAANAGRATAGGDQG